MKFILFEQNDEEIIQKIEDSINEAVEEFMPYVTILQIDVDRLLDTNSTANVNATVVFSIGADATSVGIPLTIADFGSGGGGTAQQNMNLAANDLAAAGGGY